MFDRIKQKSKGFGFVTFLDPQVADQVAFMQHIIDGRFVDVKKAIPRAESYSDIANYDPNFVTNKIFIGGLPVPVDQAVLRQTFEVFGEITDLVIIQDKITKQPRGFGFIEFKDTQSVTRIMQNYFNITVQGKWVECKKAIPRPPGPDAISNIMENARRINYPNPQDMIAPVNPDEFEEVPSVLQEGHNPSETPVAIEEVDEDNVLQERAQPNALQSFTNLPQDLPQLAPQKGHFEMGSYGEGFAQNQNSLTHLKENVQLNTFPHPKMSQNYQHSQMFDSEDKENFRLHNMYSQGMMGGQQGSSLEKNPVDPRTGRKPQLAAHGNKMSKQPPDLRT